MSKVFFTIMADKLFLTSMTCTVPLSCHKPNKQMGFHQLSLPPYSSSYSGDCHSNKSSSSDDSGSHLIVRFRSECGSTFIRGPYSAGGSSSFVLIPVQFRSPVALKFHFVNNNYIGDMSLVLSCSQSVIVTFSSLQYFLVFSFDIFFHGRVPLLHTSYDAYDAYSLFLHLEISDHTWNN